MITAGCRPFTWQNRHRGMATRFWRLQTGICVGGVLGTGTLGLAALAAGTAVNKRSGRRHSDPAIPL